MIEFRNFIVNSEEIKSTSFNILHQKKCLAIFNLIKKRKTQIFKRKQKKEIYVKIKLFLDILYEFDYVLQKKEYIILCQQVRYLLLKMYYFYDFKNAKLYYEKMFKGFIFCDPCFIIPTRLKQKTLIHHSSCAFESCSSSSSSTSSSSSSSSICSE